MEFLTPAECAEVDKTLLSSRDKFSVRLAIYALRVLKEISQKNAVPVRQITPQKVAEWIAKDEKIQEQIEVDANFAGFFTNLVISSLRPLNVASEETGVPVENLTIPQVINYFEKDAKNRLENAPNT
ncbi:hypothetical protein NG798_22890 [Ancylothrix sp. C2]|uniref:hypothetical protein n=1 Tax=Ancylothrix sp. D3o TaxID=2953691 RepID=UPI0021BA4481|nr:hypothetical protein [Ancylothrix sp. D3o]MCT7952649.1 hypothetical protein [Ancylothrix sp. D3o]